MSKRSIYINTGLFIISVLLIGLLIYWQISGEFLMANETFAMFLFSISLIFKKYNVVKAQYFLFVIFFIPLLQLANFSYTITSNDSSITYSSGKFMSLGFSPIVFIIFIAYLAVNRNAFFNLFYGSAEEKNESFDKNVTFYYNKFNEFSEDELKDIFDMYKDYPKEAQVAFLQIQSERELNYIKNA